MRICVRVGMSRPHDPSPPVQTHLRDGGSIVAITFSHILSAPFAMRCV